MSAIICLIISALVLALAADAATAAPVDLDTSFDTDGIVVDTTEISNDEVVNGIAVQADGKIVTVGADGSPQDWYITRYNTDGSLDTTFNSTGHVTTDFNGGFDYAYDVAIQSDGKIVVVGTAQVGGVGGDVAEFGVARYNTDGSLDTSFDSDGKATNMIKYAERAAAARDVVIAPSGKIIVAGYAFDDGATPKRDFAFARFNADGSADTTLEGDGAAIKSILANETDQAYGVALQPDGKIVLSGHTTDGLDSYMVAARFNENGSFDTDTDGDAIEFGVNGRALLTTTGGQRSKIVRQADGKFVLTGIANGGATTDCAVVRINEDGSPDASYSFDGLREIDVAGGEDR
ncbi:MAG: hypothetical protein ACPGWS_00385, partial [Solirubrobacterales bacterium]